MALPGVVALAVGRALADAGEVQRLPGLHVAAALLVQVLLAVDAEALLHRQPVVARPVHVRRLPARFEHEVVRGPGVRLDAQVHRAQRLDDLLETAEVDHGGAVELDAGQVLHGPGRQRQPARPTAALHRAPSERSVDLVGDRLHAVRSIRNGDPGVAWDRHQVRLVVRGRDVHQQDRVGAGIVVLLGGAGVDAEQEQVDRTVQCLAAGLGRLLGRVVEHVDDLDAVLEGADHRTDRDDGAARHEHHQRAERHRQGRPERAFAAPGLRSAPAFGGGLGRLEAVLLPAALLGNGRSGLAAGRGRHRRTSPWSE